MQNEIELLEINSPTNSSISFTRKDNKISSPPHSSSKITTKGNGYNDITNLFATKSLNTARTQLTSSLASSSKQQEKLSPRISDTISEIHEISQYSDDVFLTDRKGSLDSYSRTDSKSYKEKIKDRFQVIRENAGKSTQKASFKDTAKKLMMEKMRRENEDIDVEIKMKRKNYEGRKMSKEKMYNFFVGENNQLGVVNNVPGSEEIIETDSKIVNQSTEELINKDENCNETLTIFVYPECLRFQQKEAELQCLFRPSGKPVELSRKLDGEPRYLEDEGIFIPPRPQISQRKLNILEERLLSTDDTKWFDCEGELDILENPIIDSSMRPTEHQTQNNNLTMFSKPFLNTSECEEVLVIKENILQVNLKRIKFDHHPLFSLEHVLARQLQKSCDRYEKYMNNNTFKKINNYLEATRHLLLITDKSSGDSQKEKTSHYKKEIKDLREALFAQGKEERHLLKLSLNLWKNIKRLRTKNGYSSTSIKLTINKQSVDDRKTYEDNLQKSYQEILGEYRDEYKKKMKEYKNTLRELETSPRSESDATTTLDSPKKPSYNVDEDSVLRQLKTRYEECFRDPCEPFLRLKLTQDHKITSDIEDAKEILRRNLVAATKIHLKIICNKLTVCKTKTVTLNDNFDVNVNENISILLTNIPKFINVLVVEQTSALQKNIAAEINLTVPSQSVTGSNAKHSSETFVTSEITRRKAGVGSGVRLSKELEANDLSLAVKMDDNVDLKTSGHVTYMSFWENSASVAGANVDNVGIDNVLEGVIDKNGVIQVEKLADWVNQNKPDPQNPRNSVLYEYIQGFDENLTALNNKKYFRLNPYQKSLEFCDISQIDENIRMTILTLRSQNVPEFDGMLVPNRIKEIPLSIFKDYRRRIAHEREGFFAEDDEGEEYDSKRKMGMKNLKRIHTKVFQKCKSAANNLDVQDVLDEKYLVHFERLIKTASTNFFNWFRWNPRISRPLPELKKTNIENIQAKSQELSSLVKITIKVMNGLNVPNRDSGLQRFQQVSFDQRIMDHTVNSFVEVRYNDVFDRTCAVKGTQPVWNEDLSLVLSPTHFDYLNPNALCGNILVSVFDEIRQNVKPKEVIARNWLGSFEAPLSAICSSNGMEGHFKLNLPNVLWGYTKEESTATSNQSVATKQTYLNLRFSVQPNIPKLNPSVGELPSSDLPYIRDYIIKWNEGYNHSFPSRKFSALAINVNSKTTCLVRYIKPLEPPQLNNEGFDVEPEQCAKFVSLIPFTNCNYFYQSIWLSTDQLLHLLTGSVVDHAIALTCFLLALKLDVWLLLGFGIPHGSTAYVLLREPSKETELPLHFIYDVVTGEKISILDPYCPLQKIYCVIHEQNIWANIQRSDNIPLTRFDFTRRSDWLPLFSHDLSAPTNSVHNKLTYTPKKEAQEIETQLERKIRKLISKLRPMNRTIWNKRVSNIIKNNMHLLDYVFMHGRSNQEICNELSRNISEYDVSGYIWNFPYTNFSSIIKKIKNYGVYFQDNSDVEFSLAVQLQVQPSYIASVWIFLAAVKST